MLAAIRDPLIAFWNWRRMIWLGMRQVLNQYSRGSKVFFILALIEPLFAITLLYVVRGLFRQSTPNYGTSLFLFYASGFLPFYCFLRVSTRTRSVGMGSSVLPGMSQLDAYIATVALNALIYISMMVLIFFGMWVSGIEQARPASIETCAIPVLLLITLGTGVGMINNVIGRYIKFWRLFYAIMTRGLVFMSGVMVVVDLTPPWFRAWCVFNPLSHAIEWFRLGVYGRYPVNSLDRVYLIEWALVALFLGFVIDRAAIRVADQR